LNKLATKTLKILVFIGLFAYLQYYDVKRGAFSINSVTGGIFAASAVFLIASLFGIVLSITCNYLIAIIITGALSIFLAYRLDDLVASVQWLTEERMAYIICICVILCLIRDIKIIKNYLKPSPEIEVPEFQASYEQYSENVTEEPIKSAQEVYKETPSLMLSLSKELEKRNGRKPTYEELIDYVDNKLFYFPSDEEIKQEVQAIKEEVEAKAKKEVALARKRTNEKNIRV
jgi:hypothetical protein